MAVSLRELDDDASLVLAVQQGDTDAFGELFRRHYPSVRRVCARRLGSITEADEAAQTAFVRALEKIGQCGGERRFGAWVQVIASRICIDILRARVRTTPEEEPIKGDLAVGPNAPEDQLLSGERSDHIHLALASLPARQREVMIARHVDDRRPGEIAAAFGMSIGAVDSLLLRARRRLATSFQTVSSDSGITNLSTAAAATITSGVVAGPSRISRAFSALSNAAASASYHVASVVGLVPNGGPTMGERAAAAAVSLTIALAPVAPPAAPSAPSIPQAPTWVPGQAKPELIPNQVPSAPSTGDISGRDLVPGPLRDAPDPVKTVSGLVPVPPVPAPGPPKPDPVQPVGQAVDNVITAVLGS